MAPPLRITRIILSGPQPFEGCEFSLTDPESGEPLDLVCVLGANGTGKSMLLRQLRCSAEFRSPRLDSDTWDDSLVITEFLYEGQRVFQARPGCFNEETGANVFWLPESFGDVSHEPSGFAEFEERFGYLQIEESDIPPKPAARSFGDADSGETEKLTEFLAGVGRNREEAFSKALRSPENREKTVAEIEEEFGKQHRDLFQELGSFWARTVPGLATEFATEGDFMSKLERFEPGIRALLLRTGKLLQNQNDEAAKILFLDCPENGLDPTTALHALEIYRSALDSEGAQIFTTTDSPLIASQFAPEERIRLEKNDDGTVSASTGVAPKDTDATQILKHDFEAIAHDETAPSKSRRGLPDDDELDEDELADLIDAASWGRKR